MLLLLISISFAGSAWFDYYGDCVYDTKSLSSVKDTYYGFARVGTSLEHGDVFLSYYQYGMYGPSNLVSYFGIGVKKYIPISDRFYIEPFLIVQRDFGIKDNSMWAGTYLNIKLLEW